MNLIIINRSSLTCALVQAVLSQSSNKVIVVGDKVPTFEERVNEAAQKINKEHVLLLRPNHIDYYDFKRPKTYTPIRRKKFRAKKFHQ